MNRSSMILVALLPGCVGARNVELTAAPGVEAVTVAYANPNNIPRAPAPATVEPPTELRLRHRTSRWGFAIPALVGLATVAVGSGLLASSGDGAGGTIGAGAGLSLVGLGTLVAIGFGIPALAQKPRTRIEVTTTSTAGSTTDTLKLPVRGGRIHVTPAGVVDGE